MKDARQLVRSEIVLLSALFLVALLVRLYFIPFYRVISADGVGYVTAARELLRGNFSPLTTYGVVYPSLTALVSLLGIGTETAGRLVSAVMGSLLVVPLYLLGRDFFGRKVGTVACLLVLVWPQLRSWACEVMTQATYITLLVTWYWLLWQGYRRGSVKWSAAAGAVAGLSYLTRPESLVAFSVMVLLLLLPCADGRSLKSRVTMTAASAGAFVIMLLPFAILVHQVTGQWQLTGKGGATLADALSDYLGRPDLKNEPGFKGIGILDVIRQYPDFLRINVADNLTKTVHTILPWYFGLAALVGFAAGGWDRERILHRIYLVASLAPLCIVMVFFFVGPEYLQPYLPALFLWVGNGLCTVESRLVLPLLSRQGWAKDGLWSPVAVLAVSVWAVTSIAGQVPRNFNKPYHYEDDEGRYDQRRIGELLKKHLPPGARIMTRWGRISFYAEMERVNMPQADLRETIAEARMNRARYLIIDGQLMQNRPQFGSLFSPLVTGPDSVLYRWGDSDPTRFTPLPGVRLRLLYKDPSSLGVAVYEVDP